MISGLMKRLCSSGNNLLQGCFQGVVKELIDLNGKVKVHEYSDTVKKFALTVHFYSAQAYRYLRKLFKLPHPRTLRHWATSIDGSPGFTEESFVKIGEDVKNSSSLILGALTFNEMAIKKDIIWDGKQICGYVDLGQGDLNSEDCDVAKEALVFMVTALNRNWKIPVGYCLINGLSSEVIYNLVNQYLRKLHETGIKIVATICDGTATNRTVLQKLGVKFAVQNPQSWFPYPADPQLKVYSLLDAVHLIKLTRNLLAEKSACSWQR